MNQFKKAQVIMLPTNNKVNGSIVKDVTNESKILHIKQKDYCEHEDFIAQHLYITSNDEIKKGDWFYTPSKRSIERCVKQLLIIKNGNSDVKQLKIIATTDTSLNNCAVMYCSEKCIDYCVYKNDLPQPSQQFIEKYIESYNKGEVITDVLVEYEYVDCLYSVEKTTHKRILKVNDKYNTINIKSIKDSWNREEVIEKMWLSYKASNTIFEDEIALKMEFNNWLTL